MTVFGNGDVEVHFSIQRACGGQSNFVVPAETLALLERSAAAQHQEVNARAAQYVSNYRTSFPDPLLYIKTNGKKYKGVNKHQVTVELTALEEQVWFTPLLYKKKAVDTTGDGIPDSIAFDTTGDGVYNKVLHGVALDTNGDGTIDSVCVDTNGDGAADLEVKV